MRLWPFVGRLTRLFFLLSLVTAPCSSHFGRRILQDNANVISLAEEYLSASPSWQRAGEGEDGDSEVIVKAHSHAARAARALSQAHFLSIASLDPSLPPSSPLFSSKYSAAAAAAVDVILSNFQSSAFLFQSTPVIAEGYSEIASLLFDVGYEKYLCRERVSQCPFSLISRRQRASAKFAFRTLFSFILKTQALANRTLPILPRFNAQVTANEFHSFPPRVPLHIDRPGGWSRLSISSARKNFKPSRNNYLFPHKHEDILLLSPLSVPSTLEALRTLLIPPDPPFAVQRSILFGLSFLKHADENAFDGFVMKSREWLRRFVVPSLWKEAFPGVHLVASPHKFPAKNLAMRVFRQLSHLPPILSLFNHTHRTPSPFRRHTIVYSADLNQSTPLLAAIHALFFFSQYRRLIDVIILCLPEDEEAMLVLIDAAFGLLPYRKQIRTLVFHKEVVKERSVTRSRTQLMSVYNFIRNYIPHLLEVDEFLYTDADIVVTDDVVVLIEETKKSDYFRTDFCVTSFGEFRNGRHEIFDFDKKSTFYAQVPENLKGFNNGFLLINSTCWIAQNITQQVEKWIALNRQVSLYGLATQTPLLLALNSSFNAPGTYMDLLSWRSTLPLLAPEDMLILHFVGAGKPWKNTFVYSHLWLPHSPVL